MTEPIIEIRDQHVSFGRGASANRVVRCVDMAVARGECFGLVGESGCGKSTLLGAIAGRNKGWTGAVTMAGEALVPGKRTLAQLRAQQMVFQDRFGSLHPRHTIGRVLREPLDVHGLDDRDGRVGRALHMVSQLARFRHRFPHQLSGGQRQRAAIARAMILEPQILLLDEPTSALDVSIQVEILNLLKDLRAENGLTYLLVSHDMAVMAHLCDRIAVMQDGTYVEVATQAAMVSGGLTHPYSRLLRDGALGYRIAR